MAPDGGFLLLWRSLFDHPYWKEKRVFSRLEAWVDCWGNMAAFEEHERISGGTRVRLQRSQFLASDRFLENRWRWSRGKVRRFIQQCIDQGELERITLVNGTCSKDDTAGGTVYRVVNYEDYQPRDTGQSTNQRPRTDRARTKDKQGKQGKTKKEIPIGGPRWRVVPETWAGPNDSHRELALKMGVDAEIEAKKFMVHEYKRPMSDADRAFTSWLLKAAEFKGQRNGNGRAKTVEEAGARVIELRRSLDNIPLNGTHD